jgi:hypothetical protein
VTTSVLDRVPVDAITEQAQQVRFGHTLLTIVAAVFFGIGWLAAKSWLTVAWCAVAIREGWRDGRGQGVSHGPSRPG